MPVPLTTFIGREREIAEVADLLRESRLVSLTGAGGSGKTRLALEVVPRLAKEFPDGVGWVDLAALASPDVVHQRIASALRLDGGLTQDALIQALGERATLLVLDNCEHLVEACALLAEELLVECPRLKVLVTTREALGVAGEQAWHVPSLSLPEEEPETAAVLLESEAARLFLERARAVRSDFRLTPGNLAAVAAICRTLDGVPLAIELAAARIRVLSAEAIAQRLDHAFQLLTDGGRTAFPRHRTLRAAIDWSHDLLTEEEKAFLPRLSVFRGGFSLSAAEEVCGGPDADSFGVLDLIVRLVDRSLVEVREGRGWVRYHLLETVRQYAEERLEEAGGRRALAERHARYYRAAAVEAEPFLAGPSRRDWIDRLSLDVDNLRQALAWSREHEPELHVALVSALGWLWLAPRHWSEGARWIEGALALAEERGLSSAVAGLALARGALACIQGRAALARGFLEEALPLVRREADARGEAHALTYLALARIQEGGAIPAEELDAAVGTFAELQESWGLHLALLLRATAGGEDEHPDEPGGRLGDAIAASRALGQDREVAIVLQGLAAALLEREPARADALLRDSLGGVARNAPDLLAARGLEMMATVRRMTGMPELAARLLGAAEALRAPLGAAPLDVDRLRLRRDRAELRDALGADEAERLRTAGSEMPLGEAVALALGSEGAPASGTVAGPIPDEPSPAPVVHAAPARDGSRAGAAAPPRPGLEVRALGSLEIRCDGVDLGPEAWRLQKPRELLVHFLCHPHGRTREQIGHAFWPDASPAQVKNSFHVTLHHLRKGIGGVDRVIAEGDRYRINPHLPVAFDAARFEERLGAALRGARSGREPSLEELRSALELYRGEFLAEEGAGDWHHEHRDRLRSLHVEGLLAYASLLLADGSHEECVEALNGAIRADNLREDAHRLLMTCLSRMGRKTEALRHYDHLVSFLREELACDPEDPTSRLAAAIRSGSPP